MTEIDLPAFCSQKSFASVQPPRQTPGQYQIYLRRAISDNYSEFFDPDEPLVRELAQEAYRRGEDAVFEFGLPPNAIPGLAKLALHDFVILCGQFILLSTSAPG